MSILLACPVRAQAKEPQDVYHKGTYVHRLHTKGNTYLRMRPAMARPPLELPPVSTTTNNKEYRHMDTQENNKKHKENSTTKHYSKEQSKKKKTTPEGWKRGFLLSQTRQWKTQQTTAKAEHINSTSTDNNIPGKQKTSEEKAHMENTLKENKSQKISSIREHIYTGTKAN
eukprot:15358579-Ditylum_brightwellii.AAC.1